MRVKVSVSVLLYSILAIEGFRMRHQFSEGTHKRRHTRRDMARGGNNANLPLLSYEAQNNSVIRSQIGGSASLKCFTTDLGEEMVTWLKRDDEQLLTAGPQVYSSEHRYSVSHIKSQKLWELNIRDVMLSDAGTYECQLTTHPPVSIFFFLEVVVAKSVIRGQKELHVHEGSELRLNCHVENATEPPIYVFWFHNNSMINYVARRPLRVLKKHYGSVLTISNVSRSDAGSYRCEPSDAESDNITLHVIAGENSAAMQRGRDEQNLDENSSSPTVLASSRACKINQINPVLAFSLLATSFLLTSMHPLMLLTLINHFVSQFKGCCKVLCSGLNFIQLITWYNKHSLPSFQVKDIICDKPQYAILLLKKQYLNFKICWQCCVGNTYSLMFVDITKQACKGFYKLSIYFGAFKYSISSLLKQLQKPKLKNVFFSENLLTSTEKCHIS